MKLCRFTHGGNARIGKVVAGQVVDLSGIPGVGGSMRAVIANLAALKTRNDAVGGLAASLRRAAAARRAEGAA